MGAMLIVSIVYYALGGLWFLRHRHDSADYYGMGVPVLASQCGPNGCSTVGGVGMSDGFAWVGNSNGPWRLERGGQMIGTLHTDGSFVDATGKPATCPSDWYTNEQKAKGVDKVASSPVIGDQVSDKWLTGVASRELERSRVKNSTGYLINDREVTSDDAHNAIKTMGVLKSLNVGKRIAVIGVDEQSRKAYVDQCKGISPDVIVSEYDPRKPEDEWHVRAIWAKTVAYKPDLATGGACAWLLNEENEKDPVQEKVAFTPGELKKAVSSLRPPKLDNLDVDNARVKDTIFAGWPLNATQTNLLITILFGLGGLYFTKKPPVVEF